MQAHNCFGCGMNNIHGLQLKFTKADNLVSAQFNTKKLYEGFPNILHGGIQSTILDEAMNWVFFIEDIFVFTTKIELKFRSSIKIGEKIRIEAKEIKRNKRKYIAQGRIISESGQIATESYGEFYEMNDSDKQSIVSNLVSG